MNKVGSREITVVATLFVTVVAGGVQSRFRDKTIGDVYQSVAEKSSSKIPEGTVTPTRVSVHDIREVRPPHSGLFFQADNQDEAQLERITDDQIAKLYQLTQQYRTSANRGELWLRLGELYSEKARRQEFRMQREYDKKLALYEAKQLKEKPKLVLRGVDDYNKKAVQLYEWFVRDFPRDEKMDQALFFLGYNHMQLGNFKKAVQAYTDLTQKFPKSAYIYESYFALGEYYFEAEKWKQAYDEYNKIVTRHSSRLYDFALYKSAWCLYGMGRAREGLKLLEQVIERGDARAEIAKPEGRAELNKIRLATEARRDLVGFYAQTGEYKSAEKYFKRMLTSDEEVHKALENLAYRYAGSGQREATRELFAKLIERQPDSPKAFDYKYQIVQSYINVGLDKKYLAEINEWISEYGEGSAWAERNKNDSEKLNTSFTLQESTLRNYVLQRHQNGQKTHSTKSQLEAADGYKLYLAKYTQGPKVSEMHFFYGELLYDLGKYSEAATQYNWIVDNDPQGPYGEKAVTNSLLTLEKALPTDKKIREQFAGSTDQQELSPEAMRFEAASLNYVKKYPKGEKNLEVRFRLARIYAVYNHFDPALKICRDIIKIAPASKVAESAADLMLDIYETRKDYTGLTKAGQEILNNPALAKTKIGADAKSIVEKSAFKAALDLEKDKQYLESAKAFEGFSKVNPKGELGVTALYNAAINYERAGENATAQRLHLQVVQNATAKDVKVKSQSRRILSTLYRQTGRLKEAAEQYALYAKENPKDKEAADAIFNAAMIEAGFGDVEAAAKLFEQHQQIAAAGDRAGSMFEMAEMWRRRGNKRQALQAFERFLNLGSKDAAKTLTVQYRVAEMHAGLGEKEKAKEAYRKVIASHKKLAEGGQNVPVRFAAEAKFHLAEEAFDELKKEKIPADPKKQKAVVESKLKKLNQLNAELVEVIKMNYGPMIVAALATTGAANDHMVTSILQAPAPKGLKPEELAQYKAAIEGVVNPFRTQALEAFRSAWTKAKQLEGFSEFSEEAMSALMKLSPKDVESRGEQAVQGRSVDWMSL